MGEVIAFPTRRTTLSMRDQRRVSKRLASMGPEKLTTILDAAERGELVDWADLCDRMVQLDGGVRANYETRIASVAGARYEVVQAPSTADSELNRHRETAANFVRGALKAAKGADGDDSTHGFAQAVMDQMDAVGVGVSLQETLWHYDGTAIVPRGWTWIHQRRLALGKGWEMRLVDAGGERGILSSADGLKGESLGDFPRGTFWPHMPRARPGYPSVVGCLRPVAWAYLFKRWCTQFWVQGAEQFAWPLMVGEVPRNTPEIERDQLLRALEQVSQDHRVVIEAGGLIKMIETTVKDGGTWKELRDALDADISKSILGSVDQTQPTEVGAWKAVESRKGTTVDSRTAIDERQMSEGCGKSVVRPMLWLNRHLFPGLPEAKLPLIECEVRWIVAEKRREIPQHLLSYFSPNEIRASVGADPVAGGDRVPAVDGPPTPATAGGPMPVP